MSVFGQSMLMYLSEDDLRLDMGKILNDVLMSYLKCKASPSDTDSIVMPCRERTFGRGKEMENKIRFSSMSSFPTRFHKAVASLQLNKFEQFIIMSSLLFETNVSCRELFLKVGREQKFSFPTIGFLGELYSFLGIDNGGELVDIAGGGNINLCLQKDNSPVSLRTASLEKHFLAWLLGGKYEVPEAEKSMGDDLPPLLMYEDLISKGSNILRRAQSYKRPLNLYLFGEKGSGRELLANHISKNLSRPLKAVSWEKMKLLGNDGRENIVKNLKLDFLLNKSIPCILSIPADTEEKKEEKLLCRDILERISSFADVLIATGEEKGDFPILKNSAFASIEFKPLTSSQKAEVWEVYKKEYNADDSVNPALNGNRYVLTPGEVKNTMETASLISSFEGNNAISQKDIREAVTSRDRGTLGSYATLIPAVFTWDDLVVDEKVKRQLMHICNQLKFRSTVGDRWGFFKKTPYGRGISALLYGPPGTGKTMAVQVIANELGLDLYRVDLSKMVSKYIGETEKNISALFEKAKHMNVLLFFDEADSMFAKRSDVKDATDRSANSETAHLLQKLEEYEGITILATNLMEQIDDAFRRRIKFMIPLRFPDAETRKALWNSMIPKEAPLSGDLDLDYFAEHFELSGSQIKEVILNAAYMAASENVPLGNENIKEALMLNFEKYGKILTKDDFEYL